MNATTPNTPTIAPEAITTTTTTTTTPTTDTSAQRTHGKNFEKKEDLQLVNAYLVTSKDSEIDGNVKDRDFNALRNRFYTQISPSCSKFSGSLSMVLRHPKSGENDEDQYRRALEHYETAPPPCLKNFKFKHCFDILKQEDKWMPCTSKADEPQEVDENYVRPMGQQQAKALKKKHGVEEERANNKRQQMVFACASSIQNHKRIKHLKTIAKSARMMAKHTILSVDLNKLTPLHKLYYEKKQREIIDRMNDEDGEDEEGEEDEEGVNA
ncbi:hypothetical protein INT45_007401 [Circinella minor]|uniref:No apical meristem-associated C-terminal domain-containing protein n=1 Tax=Circinella minor TaxID=1195481 RepID=A0A8H7VBE0_9FUNG|nr:hypothetical protein INT45_007401 [Circinella minor]